MLTAKGILNKNISDLRVLIKEKKISPVEITKASLEAIEKIDPHLNSFISTMGDEALHNAKKEETEIIRGKYKGSFHGIPIGLKDMIHMKDIRTTFASKVFENYKPNYNAEVVEKLKRSGAIIMGKLNMHTLAYGTTGDRSTYGAVKNPYN